MTKCSMQRGRPDVLDIQIDQGIRENFKYKEIFILDLEEEMEFQLEIMRGGELWARQRRRTQTQRGS